MDKKTFVKYLVGGLLILAIGYGLGYAYSRFGSQGKTNTLSTIPGAAPFDANGQVITYSPVGIISGPIRENRVDKGLIIMEIGTSTPALAGTPLVRWVTVDKNTVLNRAVRKGKGVQLEKISQTELKVGDRITVDASPNNIRVSTEFTAVSIMLDLKD